MGEKKNAELETGIAKLRGEETVIEEGDSGFLMRNSGLRTAKACKVKGDDVRGVPVHELRITVH